jgi:uncharacterized phage protein (TIGR01671 family)
MRKAEDIKFRAWDTGKGWPRMPVKKMVYFKLTQLDGDYIVPSGTYLEGDYKLMQFIGHEDKNGKEVYEEDVVLWNRKLWIVRWSTDQVAFVLSPDEVRPLLPSEWETLEVIGNTCENPDLEVQGCP